MKKIVYLCLALASLAPLSVVAQSTDITPDSSFRLLRARIHTCLSSAPTGSARLPIEVGGPEGVLSWDSNKLAIRWTIVVGRVKPDTIQHTRILYANGSAHIDVAKNGYMVDPNDDTAGFRQNGFGVDLAIMRLSKSLDAAGCGK